MREVPGDDPSKAMSKKSGSDPSSYVGGWRCSLRQAAIVAHRLLDEPLEEEEVCEDEKIRVLHPPRGAP
ncbi:UNVERIFIED_CONTAM: hypothetical protein Sradi_5047300 [Sesamum radiatum]|uniref:Uncharacterized protein n=1 Tax=Sesamum radiatum TaxID=300843 RepID=A0AAW2LZZ9_SESRA